MDAFATAIDLALVLLASGFFLMGGHRWLTGQRSHKVRVLYCVVTHIVDDTTGFWASVRDAKNVEPVKETFFSFSEVCLGDIENICVGMGFDWVLVDRFEGSALIETIRKIELRSKSFLLEEVESADSRFESNHQHPSVVDLKN